MKLKLEDIISSWDSINTLADMELNVNASAWVSRQLRILEDVYKSFESKRSILIQKLGEPDKNGVKSVKPNTENMVQFQREVAILIEEEIDIPLEPKPISILGDVKIKPHIFIRAWYLWEQ